MTTFEVWYRSVADGRAPEHVNLSSEYRRGGTVVAENIRRVEHILQEKPEETIKFAGGARRIAVGDVIVEKVTKHARIYTATGAWADVHILRGTW